MRRRTLAMAAIAAAISVTAAAQSPKPEDQIRLRKAAYDILNYAFGGIDAMLEGKRPYSREDAVRNAELMAQMAPLPRLFFGEGTDKGETRAKPEIWTHRADFDAKMDKMIAEVNKLATVARNGDQAALGAAAEAAGDACKACHDEYRQKRR